MCIWTETACKSLSYRIAFAQKVLEAAACIPSVSRHPLTSVIRGELSLACTAIVPTCEFFRRIIYEKGIMGYRTLEIVLVMRRVISS